MSLPFRSCLLFLGLSVFVSGCTNGENEPDPRSAEPAGNGASGSGVEDPGPGAFWVTVSGEDLAIRGYPFTAGSSKGNDPAFVDGWAVAFSHVIVTVGGLSLAESPEKNAGDPKDLGAEVARHPGAFAVDLHLPGRVIDKGSGEPGAIPIAAFRSKADGSAFDTTSRYAFSYALQAASADASQVNLDAEGKQLYEEAITRGWSTLVVGTATYRGPAPEAGSAFAKLPPIVRFKLGLAASARYVNCANPDFSPVGGEFPRGVQVLPNRSSQLQVTYHTDHMFWDALNVEGTPLHFDPVAASANAAGDVTIDDLAQQDYLAFMLADGTALPARSNVADYKPPPGQLSFRGGGESFPKSSYADFFRYSAVAGGHLNADGECAITVEEGRGP